MWPLRKTRRPPPLPKSPLLKYARFDLHPPENAISIFSLLHNICLRLPCRSAYRPQQAGRTSFEGRPPSPKVHQGVRVLSFFLSLPVRLSLHLRPPPPLCLMRRKIQHAPTAAASSSSASSGKVTPRQIPAVTPKGSTSASTTPLSSSPASLASPPRSASASGLSSTLRGVHALPLPSPLPLPLIAVRAGEPLGDDHAESLQGTHTRRRVPGRGLRAALAAAARRARPS